MMKKPLEWDNTEAMDGTFKRLPAGGGHVCRILQATAGTSKQMVMKCLPFALILKVANTTTTLAYVIVQLNKG